MNCLAQGKVGSGFDGASSTLGSVQRFQPCCSHSWMTRCVSLSTPLLCCLYFSAVGLAIASVGTREPSVGSHHDTVHSHTPNTPITHWFSCRKQYTIACCLTHSLRVVARYSSGVQRTVQLVSLFVDESYLPLLTMNLISTCGHKK